MTTAQVDAGFSILQEIIRGYRAGEHLREPAKKQKREAAPCSCERCFFCRVYRQVVPLRRPNSL